MNLQELDMAAFESSLCGGTSFLSQIAYQGRLVGLDVLDLRDLLGTLNIANMFGCLFRHVVTLVSQDLMM